MLAKSACAVQMLLVALSRRMCCSRVCSAMRSAGRPAASRDTPMMRPGIWRLCSSGPPVAHGHTEALGRADRDIRARRARRLEEQEREEVGTHADERLRLMRAGNEIGPVDRKSVV